MTKIDLTYLESIASGDKNFIKEMLEMFSNSTYPEINNIELYQSNKNWEMLGKTAHKIKAPIQIIGQTETYNLILKLENNAKTKTNLEENIAVINKLKVNMLDINNAVKKIINTI